MLTILYGGSRSGEVCDLPDIAQAIQLSSPDMCGHQTETYVRLKVRALLVAQAGIKTMPFNVFSFKGEPVPPNRILVIMSEEKTTCVVVDRDKEEDEERFDSGDVVNRVCYWTDYDD